MFTNRLLLASFAALAIAVPATAQEKTRTRAYEGPNVSATQSTTVDRDAGTVSRDRAVTNLNTGNTATSSATRERNDTGSAFAIVQTGPGGNSRSVEGARTRTDNGSTFAGTATGRGGETVNLAGSRSRDGQGNSAASQSITNSAGETLAARNRTTTRADGQVTRNVTRTRSEGFNPPRARGKRPRG